MGKALVRKKIGDDGMFEVQLNFETKAQDIRGIETLIDKLYQKIDELQIEIENEIVDDPDPDPVEEDPDPVEEDPDPQVEEDPTFDPDPDPPIPPEPPPPPEDEGQVSGIVRGFL
jgi:hypothetical protein